MQEFPEAATSSDLLTIPQVATCLGVGHAQVYKCIYYGLPVLRHGHVVRIHRASLEQWLKDQEQTAHHS